jgi:glucose 1-dehydrogenase
LPPVIPDVQDKPVDFKSKAALITGANRGIGKGCALELARRGANVIVNYRSHADEAAQVVREARGFGVDAIAVQGDVGSPSDCRRLVDECLSAFGRIDVLVANAAVTVRKPFVDLSASEWQRVQAVTLGGVFYTAQAACQEMIKHRSGCVIAIGSVHAVLAFKNSLAYNTAKAGLNHMVRTMANEMAPHRVRVNVVEPGWIHTPGEEELSTPDELEEAARQLPLARMGTIEDIAKSVAFLASDDASYITGTVLRVDGGFVLPRPGL